MRASRARTIFGEFPELLIVISRSPRWPRRVSGSEKTSSKAMSLLMAVSIAGSLNAVARNPPFLQASTAMWLAIMALPPLPTK